MKNLSFLLTLCILVISCTDSESVLPTLKEGSGVKLLLERDNNYPLKLQSDEYLKRKRDSSRSMNADNTSLDFMNYLGRGYKIKEIPIGDPSNMSIGPVIDLNKLKTALTPPIY